MARVELTDYDRISIRHARQILADAERVDLSDHGAVRRTLGQLEAAVASLLAIVDEGGDA